jgi:protocatechuate 3,4-dioxygenase beta subunit
MLMTDTPTSQDAPHTRRSILAAGTTAAAALGLGAAGLATGAGAAEAAPAPAARPTRSASASASTSASASSSVCTLFSEVTEGPYYLDVALVRSDVTESKAGVKLTLNLTVVDSTTCAVLPNALVEIWHADALGEYSGFVGANGHSESDDGTFLRGGVLTNAGGLATITTIYPGWYRGRAIHIHLKVHTGVTVSNGSYTGGTVVNTGQLFFDETATTAVAKVSPYSTNTVTRTTLSQDSIYGGGGAQDGLLTLSGSATAGYTGTLTLGVDA